ncbi:MAG: aldo/keto reductase [Promethearchaeota archaeon]
MIEETTRRKLNNGSSIPVIGFGTYCAPPRDRVRGAVELAIKIGYRLIDTAMVYSNEKFVGQALANPEFIEMGVKRSDLFITTKVYKDALRYDAVRDSLEESLEYLGLERVDLVLIHRPLTDFNVAAWHVLEDLQNEGLATSIGVSNFIIRHLDALKESSTTTPSVNQIELHPFFHRKNLIKYCVDQGTLVEAYSPLALGKRFEHPGLVELAARYGKTPAQVMIRWSIQHGFVPIPRSMSEPHIRENFDVFDFTLSRDEMDEMDTWNEDFMVISPDPDEPDIR